MAPYLLDTCALIWIAADDPLDERAAEALTADLDRGAPVYVSPMTAWEIGMLSARGRITLPMTPWQWFRRMLGAPGLQLAAMPEDVLIASSWLPGTPPRDPADRIIAATAREFGYQVVTRDRLLLDYADAGHLQALPC
jgi:PIN domain nuclease of toxin-antitoxin system